jgi:hypothetical protein
MTIRIDKLPDGKTQVVFDEANYIVDGLDIRDSETLAMPPTPVVVAMRRLLETVHTLRQYITWFPE